MNMNFNFSNYYKIYGLLSISDMNNKKMILEPMSCILRMVLFIYQDKGTKISIYNNSITYNEPYFFQGIIRNVNGDKKDDLHNLYKPFIKSFEWYDIKDPIYNLFYQQCVDGIELLSESYDKNSIIHHTLTHYIHIFKSFLNDGKSYCDIDIKESPLLNNLKFIWKPDELKIIYDLLILIQKCKSDESDDKNLYLEIIDKMITLKEKRVYEYINKSSTIYDES
jgi:hypothetical protein